MPRHLKRRRLILGLLLLLLAAFLVPSLININRFRGQISRALSEGLGRQVEVGNVRLKLLPMPGLVAENVVVSEDPAFGRESFARMTELRANVRLRSLWTGRLSFSSLVFVEPSLNLARNSDGRWNIGTLFNAESGMRNAELRKPDGSNIPHSAFRIPHSEGPPPYLEFQDGRINFKQEDLKSVFFFSAVKAAAYRQGGRWRLRFRGTPSRTDRTLTAAGSIRAAGELGPDASSPLTLRIELVEAYVGDLLALASGSDHGIHGTLGFDAEISGPPDTLRLEGRLRVGDLHRWDLLPPESSANLELAFRGTADVPARRLELADLHTADGTVSASGTIASFLQHPAWDFRIRFDSTDVRRVFAAVEHFSPRLSPALRVDGRMAGDLRWRGPDYAADGRLELKDLSLEVPRLPPLKARSASLELAGTQVRLKPLTLTLDQGTRPLTLGLAWDWNARAEGARYLEVAASGRDLALGSLAPLAGSLGWPGVPEEGRLSWNVQVALERNAPPQITGWATVARLRVAPPWLGGAVVIHTARLDFSGDHVRAGRLVATVGNMTVTGTVSGPLSRRGAMAAPASRPAPPGKKAGLEAGAPMPAPRRVRSGASRAPDPSLWTAELRLDETSTAELDRLFRSAAAASPASSPAEEPPPGQRAPRSDFLSQLRASGTVDVPVFRLRNMLLEDLHAAFSVTARGVVLRDARARLAGGRASGQVRLNFQPPVPEYSGRIQLAGVSPEQLAPDLAFCGTPRAGSAGCEVSGTLELRAAGTSTAEVGASLRLRGRLAARDLTLKNTAFAQALDPAHPAEPAVLRSVAAEFSVQNRRIRFSRLSLHGEEWALEGTGAVGYDRSLDLDFHPLVSPAPRNGSFRLMGTLAAPERVPPAEVARVETR